MANKLVSFFHFHPVASNKASKQARSFFTEGPLLNIELRGYEPNRGVCKPHPSFLHIFLHVTHKRLLENLESDFLMSSCYPSAWCQACKSYHKTDKNPAGLPRTFTICIRLLILFLSPMTRKFSMR